METYGLIIYGDLWVAPYIHLPPMALLFEYPPLEYISSDFGNAYFPKNDSSALAALQLRNLCKHLSYEHLFPCTGADAHHRIRFPRCTGTRFRAVSAMDHDARNSDAVARIEREPNLRN